MGHAAYMRGSASISRGICKEYGCHGCSHCSPPKPTPRPPSWGDKTHREAARYAEGLARYYTRRGIDFTPDDIADALTRRGKCGSATAKTVASLVCQELAIV